MRTTPDASHPARNSDQLDRDLEREPALQRRPPAQRDQAEAIRLRSLKVGDPHGYPPKIHALVYGQISIGSDFTERDWLELALAALDQGGVSAQTQDAIAALIGGRP